MRSLIDQQLRLWEPRVVIDQIEITANPDRKSLNSEDTLEDKDSILLIRIRFFDPENIQDVQELKLEIPLPGS